MAGSNYPLHYDRGTVVRAIRYLPAAEDGAGTLGVVFETAHFHEHGTGALVRWLPSGNVCNVYEGDVEEVVW